MTHTRKKNVLVFPCGSEIGLEIHRSIQHSTHFALIGASSVSDHGQYVYADYIDGLPMHNHTDFAAALLKIVQDRQIDAIYPTMDAVAETLHNLKTELGVVVIGSSAATTAICADKRKTYASLQGHIPLARSYQNLDQIEHYPVFIKPAKGYGSRGTAKSNSRQQTQMLLETANNSELLIQECLGGPEWTIDCFSDRHGQLRFHGVRSRNRINNGISVNTCESNAHAQAFAQWADVINREFKLRGAWFFQAKEDNNGQPKLLEVAARLAGSSALFRIKGINLALLSCFDAFDQDVELLTNDISVELDRALCNRYKLNIEYTHIYIDLDDCLIVKNKINHELVGFLYKAIDDGKTICLITRHKGNLPETLNKYRLTQIFDQIVHITDDRPKSDFITTDNALFIDDSYAEHKQVFRARPNVIRLDSSTLFL